jgi:phospholipid transport system substrate-binding protein
LILLACLLVAVLAESPGAETVVRHATRDLYQKLEKQAEPISRQPELLYALVDEVLSEHVDLERMARWILGKYWRQTSDSQRREFNEQFRSLLVRTYATAIQSVSLQDIHYLPVRETLSADRAVVRTEVRAAGKPALPIDYLMHNKSGEWLVYDVRIEGVSMVTNYRTDFSEQIRTKGMQGLIEALKQKNSRNSVTDAP